ncbi:MAG: hypothetical protein GY755_05820 [Chloroflexi bacterium]|nr:hypothetical protein [Chloroflexota bacterium]
MKTNIKILTLVVILLLTACSRTSPELAESTVDEIVPESRTIPVDADVEEPPPTTVIPSATATEQPLPEATPTAIFTFEIANSPLLTQIEMLDPLNGWGQAEGMILRTEDGGESWLDITPEDIFNDPAYAKSLFVDEKNGWVLVEDYDNFNVGLLYSTVDGGANWTWRNTPFGRSEIAFADEENGYALTDLGAGAGSMGVAIWQTKNSGDDFNRVFQHESGYDSSLPFSGIKNGITFIDSQNGWVTGSQPQDAFIWFYRTQDGGFSWEHQELEMSVGYENAQTSAYAPSFFEDGQGLLPVYLHGEESAMVFYRTDDDGESWDAAQTIATRGKYAMVSANEIVVWDGGETLFFSLDTGESWQSRTTTWQPLDTLRSLDFISATEGWALTDDGLYKTKDGGENWERSGN